jgi:hypothetical protein
MVAVNVNIDFTHQANQINIWVLLPLCVLCDLCGLN